MNKIRIDGIFCHLWNYPHNRTISTTNDCDYRSIAVCELFEMLKALLPIFAHIVKEEAEIASWKIEINPVYLI